MCIRDRKKALELFNKRNVKVFTGAENKSGKDQLKVLYNFIRKFDHSSNVLFILDVDVSADKPWPEEDNNTYFYILPPNTENQKIPKGIENMFSETDINSFMEVNEKKDANGNLKRADYHIPNNEKTNLAEHLCKTGNKETFKNFQCLIEKLEQIEK